MDAGSGQNGTDPDYKSGLVAILGPTNAGKSTFLNQVLGQKVAIVSAKPQTTRNQVSGILTQLDAQVVFLDTPGLHKARHSLNRQMLHSAWQALGLADAVLVILDANRYLRQGKLLDRDLVSLQKRLVRRGIVPQVALNKVDRIKDKRQLLPLFERLGSIWPGAEVYPISALNGQGLDELLSGLLQELPQGEKAYPEDQVSTMAVRFMATEIIREKLFELLQEELPYDLAVGIEAWEEREQGVDIYAIVYVARPGQKGICIGRQGRVLKDVGQSSRQEISQLLGVPVHLELWVKVKKGWQQDRSFLAELGMV